MITIAVSQRVEVVVSYQEKRDALDTRWHAFLFRCGVTPLLIPNHLQTLNALLKLEPKGVLLTGGEDNETRIAVENLLLQYAIDNKIPLIGVCHGMQVLQRFFAVSLSTLDNHVLQQQDIITADGCRVVNSYQTMGTTETVNELTVMARSKDGVVKAVQHKQRPLHGIMWHPERHTPFDDQDISFFKQVFGGLS